MINPDSYYRKKEGIFVFKGEKWLEAGAKKEELIEVIWMIDPYAKKRGQWIEKEKVGSHLKEDSNPDKTSI